MAWGLRPSNPRGRARSGGGSRAQVFGRPDRRSPARPPRGLTLLILNAARYRIVARPVARLSAWADGVSRGDLGRGELPVVGGDEVATLAAACNRSYLGLLNAMDQLKRR